MNLSENHTENMELLAKEDTLAVFYKGKYSVVKLGRDPTKAELELLLNTVGLKELKDRVE